MRIGWLGAVALGLCAVTPAAAQTVPPANNEIVVQGGTETKASNWKRAETDHVIVFSDGGQAELVRVANNLERLHRLMTRLYRKGGMADETAKLQVTLFGSGDAMKRIGISSPRWNEGPYAAGIGRERYYDPREDGAVLAIARNDQIIKLDTKKGFDKSCDEALEDGAEHCNKMPYRFPTTRSWEALLYSSFAQHFILTYTQTVYPRWYIDGIGALFATIKINDDGTIEYARPPGDYRLVYRAYGEINASDVLTGRYLQPAGGKSRRMDWTPYHAWLITHFFAFSNLKPERARQFRDYMTAIHNGVPMAEAAKAFGDMARLTRDLWAYAARPISYARTDKPQVVDGDPLVSTLSLASAALIETRIGLDARIAEGKGADWLAAARSRMAGLPFDADATLVIAEAECRAGQPDNCLASAERVLERDAGNARALTWKGIAQTGLALAGPRSGRPVGLQTARTTLLRAIQLDGQASLPLIAYFESFTKAGQRAPEDAILGMARAIQQVPTAIEPRLTLGEELIAQGDAKLARQVLYPLAFAAEDTPEKRAAQVLLGGV